MLSAHYFFIYKVIQNRWVGEYFEIKFQEIKETLKAIKLLWHVEGMLPARYHLFIEWFRPDKQKRSKDIVQKSDL